MRSNYIPLFNIEFMRGSSIILQLLVHLSLRRMMYSTNSLCLNSSKSYEVIIEHATMWAFKKRKFSHSTLYHCL